MIPMGVMGLLVAVAVIPMKETFGLPLTDEVEEKMNKISDSNTSGEDAKFNKSVEYWHIFIIRV